jgi:hypothetical protein
VGVTVPGRDAAPAPPSQRTLIVPSHNDLRFTLEDLRWRMKSFQLPPVVADFKLIVS